MVLQHSVVTLSHTVKKKYLRFGCNCNFCTHLHPFKHTLNFSALFCVGTFFDGVTTDSIVTLTPYRKLEKKVPIPTYFIAGNEHKTQVRERERERKGEREREKGRERKRERERKMEKD